MEEKRLTTIKPPSFDGTMDVLQVFPEKYVYNYDAVVKRLKMRLWRCTSRTGVSLAIEELTTKHQRESPKSTKWMWLISCVLLIHQHQKM